jgi:hypothetical protein
MNRLPLVLAVAMVGTAPVKAESATYTHAKIALHLTHPPAKSGTAYVCQNESPNTLGVSCSNYVVEGTTQTPYSLYLVVAGADPADTSEALAQGTLGVSLGIAYNAAPSRGIDVTGWTLCADLEFPNDWPNAGGGNVITWVNCQNTVLNPDGIHAVVGAFSVYAYDADTFIITPNFKALNALAVADCNGAQWEVNPTQTARAGFSNYGCNPCVSFCLDDPVLPLTWGKVKSKYGR